MPAYLLKSYFKGYSMLLADKNLISIKFKRLKRFSKVVIILLYFSLSVSL